MTRVRIGMISYYLPGGSKIGVGYQVHEMANRLVDLGHEVTIWSSCPAGEDARYTTVVVPLTGSNRTFKFAWAMRSVDWQQFDVLHAHGDDYWLWGRRAKAHVRTIYGSCFEEALRIKGGREKLRMLLLGFSEVAASLVADRSVVISPQTARWTPWVREVVPCGVDRERFAPPAGNRREQAPTILFVGTYHQRKRGALVWKLFDERIRAEVPGSQLWMVCSDAPSAPGIEVLGRLSDADLRDRFHRAWVFTLPSTYEGFGIPYVEAMAAGVPVVATPNPGSRYVTDEGAAGRVVPDDELGDTLVALLRDPAAREQLAAAGTARSAEFDLDEITRRYVEMYGEVRDRAGLTRA